MIFYIYQMNKRNQASKKQSSTVIKIDKRLDKFMGVDLFPDKTARANKYGANIRIVEKVK